MIFPHGKEELEGIANRTDFDLGSHTKNQKDFDIAANVKKNEHSTTKLGVQNLEEKTSFIPYVIEPSAGVDRGVLAILNEALTNEEIANGNSRIVLKLKPHLSPIKVKGSFLLKNNDQIVEKAKNIKTQLQNLGLGRVMLENSGNIGKNYRRHDEIGTPICVTVDFETLEDDSVTIRDRDSMNQERVLIKDLSQFYQKYFH